MPVRYLESDEIVTSIPRRVQFELLRGRLSSTEFEAAVAELNDKINADRIHTSNWMPGSDWRDTPFQPIYAKAARENVELAGMLFGLLVFYVFMQRPEMWITGRFEKDGEPIGGRTYFIDGRA